MATNRKRPKKCYYLKLEDPLWIFKVKSKSARKIYLEMGCKEISREEYDSYEKKGKQEDMASSLRRVKRRIQKKTSRSGVV